jgi:hypothetical protein
MYGNWLYFHLDEYPSKGEGSMLLKAMAARRLALLPKALHKYTE